MTERDNVQMKLNIAGEQIFLNVPFDQQDAVRRTEKSVDALYNDWKIKFPRKEPKELLAMIAYQYASFYEDLRLSNRDVLAKAKEAVTRLDRMLAD